MVRFTPNSALSELAFDVAPAAVTIVERHGVELWVAVDGLRRNAGDGPCGVLISVSLTQGADGGWAVQALQGQRAEMASTTAPVPCTMPAPLRAYVRLDAPAALARDAVVRDAHTQATFDVDKTPVLVG